MTTAHYIYCCYVVFPNIQSFYARFKLFSVFSISVSSTLPFIFVNQLYLRFSVRYILVVKLRRTHTPQYHFAVSKQNTSIKLRCLHHKMIISNTSHSVFTPLECCCSQRTLKHEYDYPLGHHIVLLGQIIKNSSFELQNIEQIQHWNADSIKIMYSYIMIMAAVLATILAHFYNVRIKNKPCCSQHYMSISNALHLVYSAQEWCFNQRTQPFNL